jgi:serine/threonine protein kinase
MVAEGSEEDASLQREIEICSALRHPNIVSYLGCASRDGYRCIFLEFLPGGSIAAVIREFGALSGEPLRKATSGAAAGLYYLHSHSPPVVHRDIKGANLLVGSDFCVKLADFGCSRCDVETRSFTTLGSIPWMAPEVVQANGYGRKADIWSLGCTVLEMATAQSPWGEGAFDNIPFAISRIALSEELPPIPAELPESCQDLVRQCVCRTTSERLSARQVLRHPFIRAFGTARTP